MGSLESEGKHRVERRFRVPLSRTVRRVIARVTRSVRPTAPSPAVQPPSDLPLIPGDRPWLHKWNVLEGAIAFSVANNIVGDYLEFGVFRGWSVFSSARHPRPCFSR